MRIGRSASFFEAFEAAISSNAGQKNKLGKVNDKFAWKYANCRSSVYSRCCRATTLDAASLWTRRLISLVILLLPQRVAVSEFTRIKQLLTQGTFLQLLSMNLKFFLKRLLSAPPPIQPCSAILLKCEGNNLSSRITKLRFHRLDQPTSTSRFANRFDCVTCEDNMTRIIRQNQCR
jgi:hypothetical protein